MTLDVISNSGGRTGRRRVDAYGDNEEVGQKANMRRETEELERGSDGGSEQLAEYWADQAPAAQASEGAGTRDGLADNVRRMAPMPSSDIEGRLGELNSQW